MTVRAAAAWMLLIAACGGRLSEAEVADLRRVADVRTQKAFARARADVFAKHGLTELKITPAMGADVGAGLVALGADGAPPIAFVEPSCANGQSCGCDEIPILVGQAKDGTTVVVRFIANYHTQTVDQSGTCGFGCGVPQPVGPSRVFQLPATTTAQAKVVSQPYDVYGVSARCEHVIYAP